MKKITEFEECMHKIRYIERTSKDAEIANILGMPMSTFSEHKKRGEIPVEFVMHYCEEKHIDLEWLLLKKVG